MIENFELPPDFDCSRTYQLGDRVMYHGDILTLYPDGFRKIHNYERVDLHFMNDHQFKSPIPVKDPFIKTKIVINL